MNDGTGKKRALILAAGSGTRLAPLTNEKPKSLVEVNGKPILMKQIENLHANGITDITIISVYKADVLEKTVHKLFPKVKVVESVDYATTNNMYPAYLGIRSMFPDGIPDSFYMMNADVFYDASVITVMEHTSDENLIVVDVGRFEEESMKVISREDRIVKISKQIAPEDAFGCSIDVYHFNAEGAQAFYRHCREYIEIRKEFAMWSEVALNDALEDVPFHVCPLEGRWFEIDTPDDLAAAETLFAEKK